MSKKNIITIVVVVLVLAGCAAGGYYLWQQKEIRTYIRWNVPEGVLPKGDEKEIKKVIYDHFNTKEGRDYVKSLKKWGYYDSIEIQKEEVDEEQNIIHFAPQIYEISTNKPPQIDGGIDYIMRKVDGKWKITKNCEDEYLEWLPLCEKIDIEFLNSIGIKATHKDFEESLKLIYNLCGKEYKPNENQNNK
ncbi:MAG: hypothetical protein PHO31_00250 [Candidatus Pacebacteria bacterium]|nr:hypothetical protein [Candidatus Paceibacterota bacterium]